MAEIGKRIPTQGHADQANTPQNASAPRPRPTQPPVPKQGIFVEVGTQQAPRQSDAAQQPQRMVINRRDLENFLQRHPEVLQAMTSEMQQASTAAQNVPRSTPANGSAPATINQPTQSPKSQVQTFSSVNPAQRKVALSRQTLQNNIQRLVTIPDKTPPSSPFGVGEMMQASRVDITSLDTHAELYQTDFKVLPVQRALKGYAQVSNTYSHQSSIEPVRLAKDAERKNNPTVQRRIQSVNQLKSALSTALTEIQNDPAYATQSAEAMAARRARREDSPEVIEQRKSDILPFAEQYARSLGYSPEKGDSEKILQETVNFYSRSNVLANTLKSLVNSLPG